MKYFFVFVIVALAAVVRAQQIPVRPLPATPDEPQLDPREFDESPVEIPRDKRGLGFGVYAYPAPYYYGGYKTYYRSPYPAYPYGYGFRKNFGYVYY